MSQILRRGSSGEAVIALQTMLNQLGFSCGKADGVYGKNTEAAVKAFQAINGLTSDGIAGPQTLGVLAARAAAPDPDAVMDEPDEPAPEQPRELITRAELTAVREYLKNALELVDAALKSE